MFQYRVSPLAERDLASVLTWTHNHFGERARLRYEALIDRAIHDVANDPCRAGSESLSDLDGDGRIYHLKNCRMPKRTGRVRKPRHVLLYRVTGDGCVEIGRILHDRMDLERHLPDEYWAEDDD
jgi:toxin ParE1/3/4